VQHSAELDRELGPKGLVVILMESQGTKLEELPAWFMRNIPESRARCSAGVSPPIASSTEGIPKCALIGVDGTLLIEGHTGSIGQKVEKLIEVELDKVKKGWGGSAAARKARAALYGKSSPAAAKQVLEQAQPAGDDQAELDAIAKEIDAFVKSRRKSIDFLLEDGRWLEAQALVATLAKGAKGMPELEAELARVAARFETPEGKSELALDKKVSSALRALEEKKLKPANATALRALVKGAEGTKVGARAARAAGAIDAGIALKR
jgi:hypothetical protein